ncbi:hypothetical protein ACQFYA_01860 [Promicromonospora sp. Marseille-Q5078]
MTRLVLVHGRDLDGHDPDALEEQWLGALRAGLAAAGSSYRPSDGDASFVYYGDALEHLVRGGTGAAPPVTVDALGVDALGVDALSVDALSVDALGTDVLPGLPGDELRFVLAVARDVLTSAGADDDVSPPPASPEGAAGDALVAALVAALAWVDRSMPGVSGAVLLSLARDVYAYLHDDAVRRVLDDGLASALDDGPAVVVAHSLGSVVAYSALSTALSAGLSAGTTRAGGDVPLLLTLGSPLGIRAVRDAVRSRVPLAFPAGVGRWVNVRDPGDLLALTDLTPETFPLPAGSRPVENLRVDNRAPWNHAAAARLDDGTWAGYLAVPSVAAVVGEGVGTAT